jgi:uncharacterized protein YggE
LQYAQSGDIVGLLDILSTIQNIGILNLEFDVSDRTMYEQQARALAFADSQNKAQQYADLAGMTLGNPLRINENIP